MKAIDAGVPGDRDKLLVVLMLGNGEYEVGRSERLARRNGEEAVPIGGRSGNEHLHPCLRAVPSSRVRLS